MSRQNNLIVARHGLTAWARDGKHTSFTDIALLPEGETQAKALTDRLAAHPFALVLTSPRRRARDTARIAGYPDAIVDENLCEWNYGADEGAHSNDIRAARPGWDMWRDGFAGQAETLDNVVARVDAVIERVTHASGDVLAFAHGHLLRVLVARWIERPGLDGQRFTLEPASISELGWKDNRRVIHRWNDLVD
jgi:broad specificity phosphatase PhoE